MRHRALGCARVAVIGQGTGRLEEGDRAAAVAALRRGLDAGLTHIDTAEMYGDGEVERIVGEAIAGRRDEVFLVSKVTPRNATFARAYLACERSLRRLRTDRLDAYLLHWPAPFPLEQTFAAFDRLQRDGKIRAFGVSNFDVAGLERAVAAAGAGRIACNQVYYHLGERDVEHRLLAWCERHGIAVVAYSPFGAGRFPAARSAGGRVLAAVARERGATPRQVALAFLTRRPGVLAIPKAARPAHVDDNARAADLELDDYAVARIDAAFPRRPPRPRLPTLWTDASPVRR